MAQVLRETVDRHTASPYPRWVTETGDNGEVTLIIPTPHVRRHARPADPATNTDSKPTSGGRVEYVAERRLLVVSRY